MTIVHAIRRSSAYPAFRMFVTVVTWLGYLASLAFAALAAVGDHGNGMMLVAGCAISFSAVILISVGRELALMITDIADATLRIAESSMGSDATAQGSEAAP